MLERLGGSMSNYRRFITYLFWYTDGKKGAQCGYAKVERRQNAGRVELHLKNLRENLVELRPYFFAEGVRIPIGKMKVTGGTADGSFRFDGSNLANSGLSLQEMNGLLIPVGEEEVIFSQWDEGRYSWEMLLGKTDCRAEELKQQSADGKVPSEGSSFMGEAEEKGNSAEDVAREAAIDLGEPLDSALAADPVQAPDLVLDSVSSSDSAQPPVSDSDSGTAPVTVSVSDLAPSSELASTQDAVLDQDLDSAPDLASQESCRALRAQIQGIRPQIYPFRDDVDTWAIQAQLRDMKYLPEEYWPLSNNSFVLRGYFHYGNILIGCMEKEGSWFLGIPGVYHKQEKIIAEIFGFHQFRGQKNKEGKPGEFGYWYQVLNVVR